ncbi:alpha-glucoside-specific PTS transporter subunit IIBC [uncultured Anaerococcus sp.]|uniref:alpha-glucoside-specific PTS transporter subunit IIBC n=1 Tax=uncultured Anaerococcus sp. TaxID=293428 RepID=UPI0025EFA7BB|nr:alpha-glucoside-specific PTS transporter subunit IIBC [uncultured Anaerococcus sp.]
MMEKIQKFGGAMFTPVMLFAVSALLIGFGTLFTTDVIMGPTASEGTVWFGFWDMILSGAWVVFNQLPLLFAIALPIGLARKQNARASMEAFVIYLVFLNYVSSILKHWGPTFGVDFSQEVGGASGLALIANIKTLDMGMMGALLISGIAIWLHNRYFDKRLPEALGVFKGSAFVLGIGFIVMIPVAFLAVLIWPKIQAGMNSFRDLILNSGTLGVGIFVLLEKLLIPFGLHHLLYAPMYYDSLVVPGGIYAYWAQNLPQIAAATGSLKEIAPYAQLTATGWSKIFGCVGVALAFYKTALPENKKKIAGLMLPVALTAVLSGVTEPIEFTFLFIAPQLFAVHSLLAGLLAMAMNAFGVVGIYSGGVIEMASLNWIPLGANHWKTYLIMLVIGLIAVAVWYFVFSFLIKKFDFKTPGRTTDKDSAKLYSKQDYRDKNKTTDKTTIESDGKDVVSDKKKDVKSGDKFETMADEILIGLGGPDNIKDFTNCVTRLRVNVKDPSIVESDEHFKNIGTYGTAKSGNSVHVIVGMDIQYVANAFGEILKENE